MLDIFKAEKGFFSKKNHCLVRRSEVIKKVVNAMDSNMEIVALNIHDCMKMIDQTPWQVAEMTIKLFYKLMIQNHHLKLVSP